jgi:NitT/TauT family transport system permease protein
MAAPVRGDYRAGRTTAGTIVLPIVGFAAVVGLWWLAVAAFRIPAYLLPSPPQVAAAFGQTPTFLLRRTGETMVETIGGYGIAVGVGLVAGTVLAMSRLIERALYPLVLAVNSVPKVAFAPILIVWFGFGAAPKVTMVALVCFFPVVLGTLSGLLSTPAEFDELGRSLVVSRRQFLAKIQIRFALPSIFVGLKNAAPLAFIGAVIGELSGGTRGLGFVIIESGGAGNMAGAMAAVVLLGVASIALFYILLGIERLAVPWSRATTLAH